MKPYCLASSSRGNCYIFDFEIGDSHSLIMVECGIPYKEILRKCNELKISVRDIQACLITHAHRDHCSSAKDIKSIGIPLFAHKDTFKAMNMKGNEFIPLKPKYVAKGICVLPFLVNHDIDGAIGFIIKTPTETVIFVNDSKTWNDNLINFKPNYVFIECNYDQEMVYAQYHDLRKKLTNYKQYSSKEVIEFKTLYNQRERQINSHMSLAGTKRNLHKLNLNHCKAIFLMHLSRRFANEYKMKNEIQAEHKVRTYVCGEKGGIK